MKIEFTEENGRLGPPDGRVFSRFMGPTTFARLPGIDEVADWDVAIVGAPFDIGTSYRPGARFGPTGIRQGSRTLRNWHPDLELRPFGDQQVAFAPATGTPETGGLMSRELLGILRGLRGTHLVGADVVEVAPAYDVAEITSIAAANVAYEMLALMAADTA